MPKAVLEPRRTMRPKISGDTAPGYIPGYLEREMKRMKVRFMFVQSVTDDVLRRAGLKRGMRVLDLMCGDGETSILAGKLVAATGSVLGLGRSAEDIAIAERRAVEAGQCYWVQFAETEIDALAPDHMFDLIIGRPALMRSSDPAAMLQRVVAHLTPGGITIFETVAGADR